MAITEYKSSRLFSLRYLIVFTEENEFAHMKIAEMVNYRAGCEYRAGACLFQA